MRLIAFLFLIIYFISIPGSIIGIFYHDYVEDKGRSNFFYTLLKCFGGCLMPLFNTYITLYFLRSITTSKERL
jgi:hypothetical protein